MVGRHVISGVRPLRVAGGGENGDGGGEDPAVFEEVSHEAGLSHLNCRRRLEWAVSRGCLRDWSRFRTKKTARTFCCSCREASDANYSRV